jgi:integrase
MPKPKITHKTTRYPGICQRWSEKAQGWAYGLRVRGQQHDHPYATLELAQTEQAFRQQAKKLSAHLPPVNTTLAELAAAYLAHVPADRRTRPTRVLTLWQSLLPVGLAVDQVETPHIQQYLDRRLADGLKPSSIDREVNIIAATLHAADLYFAHLRQWKPPRIPRPKYNKKTTRVVITPAQYRALCGWFFAPRDDGEKFVSFHARQRAGRLFRFMMLSGCRTGEATGLRPEDVQPEYARIEIRGTKTEAARRFIKLTPYLQEVIDEQLAQNQLLRNENDAGFIFVDSKRGSKNAGRPTSKIYNQWNRACEACGIKGGRDAGFIFYSARHTAITDLISDNVDLKTTGGHVGHTRITTTQHYAHTTADALDRVADSLNRRELARRAPVDTNLTPPTQDSAQTAKTDSDTPQAQLYGTDWI